MTGAVCSQADAERADLDMEQKAIQHDTAPETAELRDIYIGRGLDLELAALVSQHFHVEPNSTTSSHVTF